MPWNRASPQFKRSENYKQVTDLLFILQPSVPIGFPTLSLCRAPSEQPSQTLLFLSAAGKMPTHLDHNLRKLARDHDLSRKPRILTALPSIYLCISTCLHTRLSKLMQTHAIYIIIYLMNTVTQVVKEAISRAAPWDRELWEVCAIIQHMRSNQRQDLSLPETFQVLLCLRSWY